MGKCLSRLRRLIEGGQVDTPPEFDQVTEGHLAEEQKVPSPPSIRVKALYAYTAQTPGDLSFEAGDLLILEREDVDGWWWCRSQAGKSGFVPSNFVQRLDLGPESLPCWFDVDRQEAMRNLMMPGYGPGVYLLRPCHQQKEVAKYTMSVRTAVLDKATGAKRPTVSHYLVKTLDNGGFYITPSHQFPDLPSLLEHYSHPGSGLAEALDKPCPKVWVPPAQFRDFEVDRNRIELKEQLGRGSFGEVYKAHLGKSQPVAVKTMTEGTMRREEFLSEGRTMHRLHHPKIVQLLGVCTKEDPIYIITEFMPHGDLKKYLLKDRDLGKVTFEVMTMMLNQIAEGMEYLETQLFIHRDLRAANILVGQSNIVKVGDFGLSKYLDEDVYNVAVENKFPIRWTAPEAATEPDGFSIKSDVWSFGVLIYEVVTKGANPYGNLANKDIIRKVGKENYRMPNPKALKTEQDENMYSIMLSCWNANPDERPTFHTLKNNFQDFATGFEKQYSHDLHH